MNFTLAVCEAHQGQVAIRKELDLPYTTTKMALGEASLLLHARMHDARSALSAEQFALYRARGWCVQVTGKPAFGWNKSKTVFSRTVYPEKY